MRPEKTDLTALDGLAIYDLQPQASELWCVAGPDGFDPATIDSDILPEGFRWMSVEEWELAQDDVLIQTDRSGVGQDWAIEPIDNAAILEELIAWIEDDDTEDGTVYIATNGIRYRVITN